MSDDAVNESNEGGNDSGETPAAGDEFKPITSQEDFEARLKERLTRERSKFADYKDVKAKAAKLDEIEEANKSEVQKVNDRLAATERERDEARISAVRFKVASKYGIDEEMASLLLTGSDEDTLTKQAAAIKQQADDRKKQGNFVPREGTHPTTASSDERETVRALFRGQ